MSISKAKKSITSKAFDKAFDEGNDILDSIDSKTVKNSKHMMQRLSIDIPKEIIEELDDEAARIGVTRTSLIKVWISEKLDAIDHHHHYR